MSLLEDARLAALIAAEERAMAVFDAIESAGLIAPGRNERVIEQDIYALAEREFGVTTRWRKRIVRSGANAVCIAGDDPSVRQIGDDDLVLIDLGPVFGEWEADVGRTYVVGLDPEKRRLCQDLQRIFYSLERFFDEQSDVTGAELYSVAQQFAEAAGWLLGGAIAGHLVGEIPQACIPGDKDLYRISPANPTRMRDTDHLAQTRYWIIEVHLIDQTLNYGGIYRRLLVPAGARLRHQQES